MRYKHIQAAHELRMWILTIATGVAAANVMLAKHPELKEKAQNAWDSVKGKFSKKENPNTKTIKIVIINEGES